MNHPAKIRAATNDRATNIPGYRRPSSLRRSRKRYRRQLATEATASGSLLEGWGKGSEVGPRDLLLIRQAIREGWETPQPICDAFVNDVIMSTLDDTLKPRLTLAAIRCGIDMVKSNRGGFDAYRRRLAARRATQ